MKCPGGWARCVEDRWQGNFLHHAPWSRDVCGLQIRQFLQEPFSSTKADGKSPGVVTVAVG